MLKLDLHIHSKYSEDGAGSPEEIMKLLVKKGLHGMAVTDHNTVEGGVRALKHAPKNFVVIPGIEVSTADGHIIGLNVKENILRELSIEETVEKILDQGGTPVVPHLFRSMSGIKKENLKKIINKIPAIEVFNACSTPTTNLKTAKIAQQYNLGGTGGSDSHIPKYTGNGYTLVDTTDYNIDTVLSEINKKKTWGEGIPLSLDYRSGRMVKSVKQFFQRGFKRI